MSARPLDLDAYRTRQRRRGSAALARRAATGNVPIALTAHPGAVGFVIGDREFWFEPDRARELGEDFVRLAIIAKRGRSK